MDRTQLVIVALPHEDDQVLKYSSEKSPHLTLLYLGKTDYDPDQIAHIEDYLEHASSLFSEFSLDVIKRGELGSDRADVLFFSKSWSKRVAEFRTHLLREPLISTAYQSVEQYPEWTPHLTMGYPDRPAKKDTREHPGINYIRFTRIALWTGDSKGREFPLKIYDDDSMEPSLAMSMASGRELVHYGVKGMRWGVRRDDSGSGGSAPSSGSTTGSTPPRKVSDDYKSAVAAQRKINAGGTPTLSNKELQGLLTRMNLERQYSSLHAPNPSIQGQKKDPIDRGHEQVRRALAIAKTYDDVQKFVKSPTGQAIKTGVTGAAAAAAAYFTGGASAAAGAGASVVIRRLATR